MSDRKQRIVKLDYESIDSPSPGIALFSDPAELRLFSSGSSFLNIRDNGITISGGIPSVINIQGMSSSFRYAGMLQDLPFPLSLIPSTAATPLPKQIPKPPFENQLQQLKQFASMMPMFLV